MDRPSISVVVPTYDRSALIGATLDAILAQELPATEIIVVDDGSTDRTADVLSRYGTAIRTIRIVNGGDLVARNVGLRAAGGQLVAFCDSDDLWRPQFLRVMATLWCDAPGLVAGYANFQAMRGDVLETRSKFDDAPEGFWDGARRLDDARLVFERPIIERLLAFQPLFPSAMMVERAAFLRIGGWDEAASRIVGSDLATALRAAEHELGLVTQPLVAIRRHPGNFSSDVQAMHLGDARILEEALQRRPALARHRDAVLASVADRRAAAADLAFDRRAFDAVRQIQSMLPAGHLPWQRRMKGWISGLPPAMAHRAATLASGATWHLRPHARQPETAREPRCHPG